MSNPSTFRFAPPMARAVLPMLMASLAAIVMPSVGTAADTATAGAKAGKTQYPLTLENCGATVTFQKAPERAVGLGQNSAEILLMLGLEDRMVATAFWPTKVLPELADANAKVKLLTVEFPTLESILAQNPDFVASMLPTLMGPGSKVAKREDFSKLKIGTYASPSTCLDASKSKDAYGSRAQLWNMEIMYKEIDELAKIFDVQDRGQKLIADLKAREAKVRQIRTRGDKPLSYVFWFSSPSPSADAYLGGKNGASGQIADMVNGVNAIKTETEWPTVGWEGIIASNPDVIVVAHLDRNRWELDKPEAKIRFLTTDPATSKMPAVQNRNLFVIDGQAMNPSIRTLFGAEELAKQLKDKGLAE